VITLREFPRVCDLPVAILATFNYLFTGYGAVCRAGIEPGATVLITGATGGLGAMAVACAFAKGAGVVYGVGRNAEFLNRLDQSFGSHRFIGVSPLPEESKESFLGRIQAMSTDVFIDALGGGSSASEITLAAFKAVRPRGSIVLFGGVSDTLPLAYADVLIRRLHISGSYMYETSEAIEALRLVNTGILNVDWIKTKSYVLSDARNAISDAKSSGASQFVVFMPGQ
jgi:alcohol dehydrogenase